MNSYNHPTPEEIYENIRHQDLNSCEKRMELEKLPIKPFKIPKKLYQYRRFDEGGHNVENLKNSQIWCSSVKNFNDLYEGTLKLPSDENYFIGIAKTNPKLAKTLKNNWHRMSKANREKKDLSIKSLMNKVTPNVFAASCFTINKSCHPMWAYYADNHKGFCVEFDFATLNPNEFPLLYPISYSNEKIDFNANGINENNCTPRKDCPECHFESLTKTFITKAKDWEYEQEWRILIQPPNYGKTDYSLETDFPGVTQDISGCITCIYLGAKIEPENEATMIAIAKDKNIPIYKKEPSHDSFELQDKLIWSPN